MYAHGNCKEFDYQIYAVSFQPETRGASHVSWSAVLPRGWYAAFHFAKVLHYMCLRRSCDVSSDIP